MLDLAASERAKYTKVWTDDAYRVRSPGLRHLAGAVEWMQPEPGASITDWGAGSGQAADALDRMGYAVRLVDIAANAYRGPLPVVEACLWQLPDDMPATDYGFCADVMEHVPTEHVSDVLHHIKRKTRKAVYFQIALFDDTTYTHAGPLHLSVFPPEWWQEKIAGIYGAAEFRMFKQRHLLVVARP